MPAIGAEIADAFIEVHADTGPFRRELRREARLAAQEASDGFGTEFTQAVDRDLSPLGARISEALREAGELGGRDLMDEIADQVRARAGRINNAFAQSVTFGDFAPFIEQFNDLDDAIEDFDSRLRTLNKDGTLTNDVFDRLNASFNAYVRTIQDDAISQALARDREEAVKFERASERLVAGLNDSAEATRRFNIGLGSLKGSRNDFLNFIGSLAGFLERNIGSGLERLFEGIGNGVSTLGQRLSQVDGPLGAVGLRLDSFGNSINKLGAGGLDGLIVQVAALILGLQALVVVMGPLAAGISGVAAAITALAVGIGGALLGGVLALGPGLTALAAGAGAVAIAFTDLSKSQKAVFDPLKNLFDEVRSGVQEQLFSGLGGQVEQLTSALAPVGPFLNSLAAVFSDWVSEVVAEIGPGGPLSATFDSLGDSLPGIFRTLLDLVSATGGALTGLFAGAGPGAERLFQGITRVVEQFSAWANSAEGQQQINTFLQQAVDILTLLWQIAQQAGAALGALWEGGAQEAASALLTIIRNLVTSFNEWLRDPGNREQLLAFFRNGVQVATSLGQVIGALIQFFASLDNSFTRLAFQVLIGHVVSAINVFTDFSKWTLDLIRSFARFVGQVNTVVQSLGNLGARAAAAGQTFRTNISNAFNAAITAGRNLRQQLINTFNSVVQSISGFVARAQVQFQVFINRIRNIQQSVQIVFSNIVNAARTGITNFSVAISNGVQRALTAIQTFATNSVNSVTGLAGRFASIGADVIRGFYNGVVGGAGRVLSFIRGLADDVAATFASVLGIASPSKVFRSFGGDIVNGLIEGMNRREKAARKESDDLALAVIDSAQATLLRARESLRSAAIAVSGILTSAGSAPRLVKAFQQLGSRAITALTNGLSQGRSQAQDEIQNIVKKISEVAREAMKGEDKKTRTSIVAQSKALQDWVKSQGKALDLIWREVDRAGTRLDAARERLQELQQEFTQMREQVRDSLRGELDLGGAIGDDGTATFESVSAQVSGLAQRMKTFAGLIKKLIQAGFPAALVQEVAALGTTEGIAVANALLSGTKAQQQGLINDFESIQNTSDTVGKLLAEQMFRAGIEAQKGLIKGLEADQAALVKAAEKLAKKIADAVRKELGIKSPSTVFRQIGLFITEGLAEGIEAGQDRVDGAVSGLVNPDLLPNTNAPIGALAAQQAPSGGVTAVGGIAAGAITIVSPFANPRLVALETLDALAARGK